MSGASGGEKPRSTRTAHESVPVSTLRGVNKGGVHRIWGASGEGGKIAVMIHHGHKGGDAASQQNHSPLVSARR